MRKLHLLLALLAFAVLFAIGGTTVNADSGGLTLNTRLWCRWNDTPEGYGQTEWRNWTYYWEGKAQPKMYLWYNNSWLYITGNEATDYGQQGNAIAYVNWGSPNYWFTIVTTHIFPGYSPSINYTSYPATWCGY